MRKLVLFGCALSASVAAPCRAATTASLDFLGGDWVLLDPAGKPAGRSHIEVQRSGAMIYERRTDHDGELSVWFVNSEEKDGWVQLFPGPAGSLRQFAPQSKPGEWPLVLGSDVTLRDGRRAKFRLTLSRGSGDETHRVLEMSTDQAKTWAPIFDYRYVRAATP